MATNSKNNVVPFKAPPSIRQDLITEIGSMHRRNDILGLSLALAKAKASNVWRKAGHKSFNAFCKDLDIGGWRKARYLIETTENMKKWGYSRQDLRTMLDGGGWTKVSMILREMTHKMPVEKVLALMDNRTVPEIRSVLNQGKAGKKGYVNFTAQVSKKDAAKLYAALEIHGMKTSKNGKKLNVGKAFSSLIQSMAKA